MDEEVYDSTRSGSKKHKYMGGNRQDGLKEICVWKNKEGCTVAIATATR